MQSAGGGLSDERVHQVRGFKWIKRQGKVHGDESTWRREMGEGHQRKEEQENQQVEIVGVTDLQSGEDGLEVNMNDVMDQIQNLQSVLAQYVIRREVKVIHGSLECLGGWDGGGY